MRLLALSGSLRANSSNALLLRAGARLAASLGITVSFHDGLAGLPHFNPDLDEDAAAVPAPVAELRAQVGAADGLLISCPEYARGVPGSFKNALDWLVSSTEFPGKPVALWNASPRATAAQTALVLILETMSARVISAAGVALPVAGRVQTEEEIIDDPTLADPLQAALAAFARAIGAGGELPA